VSQSNVILLVEDDPNDAFFFSRALSGLGFNGKLHHVTDIEEAKAYLLQARAPANADAPEPLPELIVADSAVAPRGSGVELLEWQRAEGFNLPFFILTGSIDPVLRERAEAAGVQRVLTKTSNLPAMAEQLREIISALPPARRSWLK
jgi:CheY-like chemotaxis protein